MRLTVKTHHIPNERQARMLNDYVLKDNMDALAYDEEVNFVYSLTESGREFVSENRSNKDCR